MAIAPTGHAGIFSDGSWLYTRNLVPGRAVYGESLRRDGAVEYRAWDANRSKLAAYLKKGGTAWPFRDTSTVLYLGAASGTTASHLSDVCSRGTVFAVEISPRSFRDLVVLSESRTNLIPILGDAERPEAYASRVGTVDVLYQDVAQRDQHGIFLRNVPNVRRDGVGFLMVKARSEDSAADPKEVAHRAKSSLAAAGLEILDARTLDPFAEDHAALAVRVP
jgi:fibrillarin-like pre-rRNA processing protein